VKILVGSGRSSFSGNRSGASPHPSTRNLVLLTGLVATFEAACTGVVTNPSPLRAETSQAAPDDPATGGATGGTPDGGTTSGGGGGGPGGAAIPAGQGGAPIIGSAGTGSTVGTIPGTLPPLPAGAACRVGVPLRRLTEAQIRNAIRDLFGGLAVLPSDFALATVGTPQSGFTTDPDYNEVDLSVSRELDRGVEAAAVSIVDKLSTIVPCASVPNQACAATFIDLVGRRAFRRPLASTESQLFLRAYQLGSGTDAFKDGIAAVVTTMLQSPQFLYQAELGTPAAGEVGVLALTPYELASRLSFLLWDSIPDDTLLNAARDGHLLTTDDVRASADRMLADAKARPTIVRFAREWIRPLVAQPGVDRTDPAYTQPLANAMQAELDKFVGDSFLVAGTSLNAFFTSSAPFSDASLTTFYTQNGGVGPRSGLLTQPAFLTGIANPTESSPIRRGVFVRRKLTCEVFPNPPNDALTVEGGLTLPANANNRLRSQQRNLNARCTVCHSLIDPVGLGFESFDEIGRYRTVNHDGTPVDPSGEFVRPVSPELAGTFASLPELGARLASSPAVQQCMTRQFFRFNYGRLDGTADDCAIQGVLGRWTPGMDLRTLLLEMVSADEFRFRRVQ